MIPLVRSEFPSAHLIEAYFRKSKSAYKLTNFGPCYQALVRRIYDLIGKHAVPVTSGTAAIQMAAQVTFPRGSRVLCPDYTHIGTLQALISAGMSPILVPVEKTTWTINPAMIRTIPRGSFDGFVVVSPFGYSVDFDAYDQLSKEIDRPVIYDLAGGWGLKNTRNPVCYSFHATKNIPVGEGGVVCFDSEEKAHDAKQLSCFSQNIDRSIANPFGGNHKLDEFRCAVALAQLENESDFEKTIQRKKNLLDFYQRKLSSHIVPHSNHKGAFPSLCVLAGLPAQYLESRSKQMGFEIKQYYPLLSEMPGLLSIPREGISSQFFRTCAALPSDVLESEAEFICETIVRELKAYRAKGRSRPTSILEDEEC